MKMNWKKTLLVGLAVLGMAVFGLSVNAQDRRPPDAPAPDKRFVDAPGEPPDRPDLLRELGLQPEQIQALRRINQERKPIENAARQRFQDATRALNLAIYADEVDESAYRTSLIEYQSAQAELARIKFSNELAVRRLLTPAQLMKFRELRRRFAEARERNMNRQVRRPQPQRQFPGRQPVQPPNNK